MIIFPPILTFAAIGLVTMGGIFDEIKNSKPVNSLLYKIENNETVKYLKLVNRIASQYNDADMEWTKNHIRNCWNEYCKEQNRLQETSQKFVSPIKDDKLKEATQRFVCPFSDEQEFVLINQ